MVTDGDVVAGERAAWPLAVLAVIASAARPAKRFFAAEVLVPRLAGLILVCSGVLKLQHVSAGLPFAEFWFPSRGIWIALAQFELVLGILLWTRLWPQVAWAVAVVAFATFSCAAAAMALLGRASCGCFGALEVDPRLILIIDLCILAALARWRPSRRAWPAAQSVGLRYCAAGALWGLLGAPAAYNALTLQATMPVGVQLAADGRTMVLYPEDWVGERFPLLPFIKAGECLEHGEWLVVLHRAECPGCAVVLQKYANAVRIESRPGDALPVALIEIPQSIAANEMDYRWATARLRLSDAQTWLVRTPTELSIKNGIVKELL